MKLKKLLENIECKLLKQNGDGEISSVAFDSRKVCRGSLFVCIRGAVSDGHRFIPDAVAKGAAAIVIEQSVREETNAGDENISFDISGIPDDVAVISVKDTRYALACISAAWFGHPAQQLKTIGITGTKGKTTTTYMVKSILENAGYKVDL